MIKMTLSVTPKSDTQIILMTETKKIKDFEGKKKDISVRYEKDNTVIYVGLGETKNVTADIIRSQVACAIRKAARLKRNKVSIVDPILKKGNPDFTKAIVEGAILGSYIFDKYKSEKTETVASADLVTKSITTRDLKTLVSICEGIYLARDLINDNASVVYPQHLATVAQSVAKSKAKLSCKVLTEKEIKANGLGLLYAVGQASPYQPRLVIMEYKGAPKSKEKIAIVGKGITFDTGGLNLKPSGHIETMRSDMSGAATVLGLMKALVSIEAKVNVIGVITAAHSVIGSNAYIPGDTYKSYSGKTVEILNTDAEGRLILADAISYCQKKYKPTKLIDLATLTGAVVGALGYLKAGLFSNNDQLSNDLLKFGDATDEPLWRLPVLEEHSESMKSDIADLRNTSKLPKGHCGSSTAAAFLQEFIIDIPWAHIDLAGTAFNSNEPRGAIPKFGTGYGIRLLIEYLLSK